MSKTQRQRAIGLALLASLCLVALSTVAVDWKRFGGGFLAFLHGRSGAAGAVAAGSSTGPGASHVADASDTRAGSATLPRSGALVPHRGKGGGGGHGGRTLDADLFEYGDPSAGGIPPGSFVVAQDEPEGGGGSGATGAPEAGAGPAGGNSGGDGGGMTAPAPGRSTGKPGDTGLPVAGGGSTPPTPPATDPTTPVAPPATDPIQSGSSDGGGTPPPSIPTPVSAVPEASSAAMLALGALFLAATIRRNDD
jgi:hypothetical protein